MNNLHIYTTRAFQDDPELKRYNPEKEEEEENKIEKKKKKENYKRREKRTIKK